MKKVNKQTKNNMSINYSGNVTVATYIGNKQKGFWGSLFATLGVVLPSLIIIFIISLFFETFLQNQYVQYAFVGIKCGVAFLILATVLK